MNAKEIEMNSNIRIAKELVRLAKSLVAGKQWLGNTTCDICHKPITKYLYDAVTESGFGSWGTMCRSCWQREGAHLGGGQGQEYVETEPGKFEMNRGGMSMGRKSNGLKPYKPGAGAAGTGTTGI